MPARPVLRAPGERQSAASEAVYRYSERASRSMAEKDPPVQSARDFFARQSAASEAVSVYSERASRSMAEKDPLIYQVMSSSNSIRLSSVGSAWMMARM